MKKNKCHPRLDRGSHKLKRFRFRIKCGMTRVFGMTAMVLLLFAVNSFAQDSTKVMDMAVDASPSASGVFYYIEGSTDKQITWGTMASAMRDTVQANDYTISGAWDFQKSLTAADLDTGAVSTLEILDETIAASDIDTNAVTTSEILDGTITAVDISTGGVTTTEILDKTIVSDDLDTNSVTESKLKSVLLQENPNVDYKNIGVMDVGKGTIHDISSDNGSIDIIKVSTDLQANTINGELYSDAGEIKSLQNSFLKSDFIRVGRIDADNITGTYDGAEFDTLSATYININMPADTFATALSELSNSPGMYWYDASSGKSYHLKMDQAGLTFFIKDGNGSYSWGWYQGFRFGAFDGGLGHIINDYLVINGTDPFPSNDPNTSYQAPLSNNLWIRSDVSGSVQLITRTGTEDYITFQDGTAGNYIAVLDANNNFVIGNDVTDTVNLAFLDVKSTGGVFGLVSAAGDTLYNYGAVTDTTAISTPHSGDELFSKGDNKKYYYNGTYWVQY